MLRPDVKTPRAVGARGVGETGEEGNLRTNSTKHGTVYPEADIKYSKPTTVSDLDDLEGQEYEEALAKLPEAERAKYMNAE